MAGQSTVLSADGGLVTVPSSGEWTAVGIQQVQTLLFSPLVTDVVYNSGGVPPIPTVPAGSAGTYVLEIPNGTNVGSLAIPDNYGAVIFGQGSSGSVTGGTANTTVLSAASVMSYSGNAGEVVQTATVSGATATIVDNAAGAVFDLGGGSYSLTAGGNQQTIQIDPSATVAAIVSGSNDSIQLGDTGGGSSQAVAALAAGAGSVSGTNLKFSGTARGESVTVNSFGNVISDSGAGSTTIAGVTGSSTIFAGNNDVYYGAGAITEFIAFAGAQTVFGGTGNDTVFNAGSSITYNEGSGSHNVVANATGNMTINGNGAGDVFGGTGTTNLVLGNGNDVFVGGSGASALSLASDTIYGGSVVPTVFGGSNETMQLVGSHAAFIVAGGNNSSFSAKLTNGGDNFFATSATGNTTLVASSGAVADTFNIGSVAGGTAHVITISNFQTGDALFLGGFNATDIQTMDTAILGGKSTFTLSDGTTVSFTAGQQPTHALGSVIF